MVLCTFVFEFVSSSCEDFSLRDSGLFTKVGSKQTHVFSFNLIGRGRWGTPKNLSIAGFSPSSIKFRISFKVWERKRCKFGKALKNVNILGFYIFWDILDKRKSNLSQE